ncbi:MAG: hypothetical protein CL608_05095 [Anaerolineaceae bacterium]|nr:hypothetical protein [Anaerolineaceae bacterium]
MALKQFGWLVSLGIILLLAACNDDTSAPTAVATVAFITPASPTETAVATSTPTFTASPTTVVVTAVPSVTPTASSTPTPDTLYSRNANPKTPQPRRPTHTPVSFTPAELQATIIAKSQDSYTTFLVQENLAYVAFGKRLFIVDVSMPSQPILVGETVFPNQIEEIQVVDDTLYAIQREGENIYQWPIELAIVDVTDPTNPSKLGLYSPEFLAIDAIVIGDIAHVIGFKDDWEVVDVSNPRLPTKIGTIQEGWSGSCSGCYILSEVREIDGYLHLFPSNNRYSHPEILIYDVSEPLNPRITRELSYRNGSRTLLDYSDPDEDAYTVIVIPNGEGFLFRILDLSSPGVVGELLQELPNTSIQSSQSGGLVTVDHYVYFASSDGLYILDVLERFRPSLANSLYPNAYFSDIVKANGLVYLLDWDDGLVILDVSDPLNPVEVGKWQR